jgi:hypothetical protein
LLPGARSRFSDGATPPAVYLSKLTRGGDGLRVASNLEPIAAPDLRFTEEESVMTKWVALFAMLGLFALACESKPETPSGGAAPAAPTAKAPAPAPVPPPPPPASAPAPAPAPDVKAPAADVKVDVKAPPGTNVKVDVKAPAKAPDAKAPAKAPEKAPPKK